MKKIVLLAATAAIAQTGFSQVSIDPEVGVNFSNTRFKLDGADAVTGDVRTGFSGGVGVNFGLGGDFYLRPGVYYQGLGSKSDIVGVATTTSLHYLRIPVNVGYNFNISKNAGSIFAEVGPYVGYAIAGQSKTEILGVSAKSDIDFGSDAAEMNPLDFGVNFGLGYESPWGIYLKGGYGLGLGNMSNIDDIKNTNTHFNISLGYRIKL
ncbi:MAG: PorT family protein [Sphingobacteriales bacterium]|nr:MAG: PorT family protein [Sphingobacteriales bacterium]